jgi:hypothetical protein
VVIEGTGARQQREYDNTHVIAYNPGLSRRCKCHVNVEVTTGIKAVKYIYKYIYKGDDRALVRLDTGEQVPRAPNELKNFVDSRYICARQAAWRLLHYTMHDIFPPVVRLVFNMQGLHQIVYSDHGDVDESLTREANNTSMLLDFFWVCREHPEVTQNITYAEAPSILRFKRSGGKFDSEGAASENVLRQACTRGIFLPPDVATHRQVSQGI